jgi:hypothetical protein
MRGMDGCGEERRRIGSIARLTERDGFLASRPSSNKGSRFGTVYLEQIVLPRGFRTTTL